MIVLGVLKKIWVQMCCWKFWLPPDSKTSDEPNLQPIFKPNFLFCTPFHKLLNKFSCFCNWFLTKGENEKGAWYLNHFFKKIKDDYKTWGGNKGYRSQLHIRTPTYILSTPCPGDSTVFWVWFRFSQQDFSKD